MWSFFYRFVLEVFGIGLRSTSLFSISDVWMRALVLFVLFVCGDVRCMLCCWFFSSSCVSCVASFSGLSIFDCPFGVLWRLFNKGPCNCYAGRRHRLILITVTRAQTHRAAQRFPIYRIGSSLAKEWGWQIMVRKVGPFIIVGYVSIGIIICGFTFHGIDILDFRFEFQSFIHSIK